MKIFLILLTVLAFSQIVLSQNNYKHYNNARFGYSIDYPANLLIAQPPSFSGDGRIFLSKDKETEMRVWGEFNAVFQTLKERYEENLKDYGKSVTYKILSKDGFVMSGVKGDKIFYQKTLYHKFKDTDVFYTFTIEYKKSDRKIYDSVVERIAKSFRFDIKANV